MRSGRHFLQIPGPSNVPDRILRAMDRPTIDHRGPDFAVLGREVLDGCRAVFGTEGPVVIFPSSGTGAWEAAIVNTLSPGDHVVMAETGQFATLWRAMAERLGLRVTFLPGDWRRAADPDAIGAALAADPAVKAVMVVHNETSTGATTRVAAVRAAMDRAGSDALLMVDAISSLGSVPVRHDEWRADVTVACSQKGLMLPPGLGFNAVSARALAASENGGMPRSYWNWAEMLGPNASGFFPYTPATNLLYGLREALATLLREWSRRHGIRADLEFLGDAARVPAPVETAVYRIVQEALTNVLKHAGAATVSVAVEHRTDAMRVIVEDDGIGFDAEHAARPGGAGAPGKPRLGLSGIRERLALLDGTLTLETSPGIGTALFVDIPVPQAA